MSEYENEYSVSQENNWPESVFILKREIYDSTTINVINTWNLSSDLLIGEGKPHTITSELYFYRGRQILALYQFK